MNTECRTETYSKTTDLKSFIERFSDPVRIEGYCKECRNYGRMWACPPLSEETLNAFREFEKMTVIAVKIIPTDKNLPLDKAAEIMRPVRVRLEKMMLDAEKEYGGRALAFAGECLLCGDEKCTRPLSKPCRHPQKVRPSLEACGFDVNKIAEELLGIEIKWGHDNKMPEYLLLTCAFAHNQDNISTEW